MIVIMIPKAKCKSFENEQEAAPEVVSGRADAFVYDLPYCVSFFARQGKKNMVVDEPGSALDPEMVGEVPDAEDPGQRRHDHGGGDPLDGFCPRSGRQGGIHGLRLHSGGGRAGGHF